LPSGRNNNIISEQQIAFKAQPTRTSVMAMSRQDTLLLPGHACPLTPLGQLHLKKEQNYYGLVHMNYFWTRKRKRKRNAEN